MKHNFFQYLNKKRNIRQFFKADNILNVKNLIKILSFSTFNIIWEIDLSPTKEDNFIHLLF